jgi:hypothetical protein
MLTVALHLPLTVSQNVATVTHQGAFCGPPWWGYTCSNMCCFVLARNNSCSLNISILASLALAQLLASSRKSKHVELPATYVED